MLCVRKTSALKSNEIVFGETSIVVLECIIAWFLTPQQMRCLHVRRDEFGYAKNSTCFMHY